MEPKIILAVDDESSIRTLYERMFSMQGEGFSLHLASNGQQALEFISKEPCDCLILDLTMPGISGFEVLERVRSMPHLRNMPVIVVTASDDEYNGRRALQMGADDYINKPFSVMILMAKVEMLLKKAGEIKLLRAASCIRDAGIIERGPLKIDFSNRIVFVNGISAELRDKEFDLLAYLATKDSQIVSWSDIHKDVWMFAEKEPINKASGAMLVTLSNLKNKLGTDAASLIKVIKGRGIQLSP